MSLGGYQKHVSSCSAPAPLTAAEQELQQIRINEVGVRGEEPDTHTMRRDAGCRDVFVAGGVGASIPASSQKG